jgi:hypothetical protein
METAKGRFENHRPNHRKALAVGALGVLPAVLLAADRISGEVRWRQRETTVDFCGGKPPEGTDHTWLGVPPLGLQSSEVMNDIVGPALDAPMSYIELPEKKPTVEAVGDAVARHLIDNDIRRLSLINCSMGGILSCYMLPYLPGHMKLDNVVFDCSPVDIDDVKAYQRTARNIGRSRYKGGVFSSVLAAAISHKTDSDDPDRGVTLGDRLHAAQARVGPDGGSAMTWTWQVRTVRRANQALMQEQLRKRLTPETRIAYIMPEDPARDEVVDVVRAANRWEEICGRPIDRIYIPDGTHASALRQPEEYKRALGAVILDRP